MLFGRFGSHLFATGKSGDEDQRRDTDATPAKYVTMQVVKGRGACCGTGEWDFRSHITWTVNGSTSIAEELTHPSVFVHPTSEAVVRAAEKRTPVFDRAEKSSRGVLPLRRAFAEPAVVGQVHKEISVRLDVLAGKVGKNILEA